MSDYPQSFRLTKLYRKEANSGGSYFVGRLGGAKVTPVKSKYNTEGDTLEVWNL